MCDICPYSLIHSSSLYIYIQSVSRHFYLKGLSEEENNQKHPITIRATTKKCQTTRCQKTSALECKLAIGIVFLHPRSSSPMQICTRQEVKRAVADWRTGRATLFILYCIVFLCMTLLALQPSHSLYQAMPSAVPLGSSKPSISTSLRNMHMHTYSIYIYLYIYIYIHSIYQPFRMEVF